MQSPPLKVTIVVGNPKPASRTLQIARRLADKLFASSGADIAVIDLADHAPHLFDWTSTDIDELMRRVRDSDVTIFATPTYKATFTGLLKAFLDRFPANGLAGIVALVVMTGADAVHSLAPQVTVIPLLLELAATVPNRGLFFNTADIENTNDILDRYAAELRKSIGALAKLQEFSN